MRMASKAMAPPQDREDPSLHVIPSELAPPKNAADFELMCANIYRVVYGDPTPKINGRNGQAQGGVDIFVTSKVIGRIGIQCKKYFLTQIELKHVEEEVAKADKFQTPIAKLLIATTSQNDAALLKQVQQLSDERANKGKFSVEIEFWDDIQLRIDSHTILQDCYKPQSPGAAYYRQHQQLEQITNYVIETHNKCAEITALPQGRGDSANRLITIQLDKTNKLIRAGRYRDALEHINTIGDDLALFDHHQKARWYLQRGLCLWFSQNDEKEAAVLFLKASNTYPDDEKMAAAGIRGRMMSGDIMSAIDFGKEVSERFPLSIHIWLALANARMVSGERIKIADVPSAFRDETETFLVAAMSARQCDDVSEAAKLASRAAENESADFFIRAAFLRFAVENYALEPVLARFGLVDSEKKARLERAVSQFDDRNDRLWNIQADACIETATHLGFAFLLLGQPLKARTVSQEARARGFSSPELIRVEIQALDEEDRIDDALAIARASITELTPEALSIASEIASNKGNTDFLDEAARVASGRFPEDVTLRDFLLGQRWLSLFNSRKASEALGEILSPERGVPDRPFPLSVAARLLKREKRSLEAMEMVDRAVSLITSRSETPDRLTVAELLSNFERWTEAASLYEGILAGAGKGPSTLHAKLLECYVESNNRSKARALLVGMPDGWGNHDETRKLAINLGYKAGDWQFLLPLMKKQLSINSSDAVSWLLWLEVLKHTASPPVFQDEMKKVPDIVLGSIHHIGMLASVELSYGQEEKGLRRLYRLVRSNMDEPEAYSDYLNRYFTSKLPQFEDSATQVTPGCVITILDETGSNQEKIVIDPVEISNMPKRDGFFPPDDPDVSLFIGKDIGAEVDVPLKAGGSRLVRIVSIGSAYSHMATVAMERERRFNGIPNLKSVPVGNTGDPETDLALMHEEIRRSRVNSLQVMEVYASGVVTLSRLAKFFGRSPIDLCMEWPSDAPPLFVGNGQAQERDSALCALNSADLIVVADSTALCEMARHRVERALSILPRVLISSETKKLVDSFVDAAENDKSSGMVFDNGGKLRFVEFNETWKSQRIAFARRLAEIVAGCEVLPAYGDLGPTNEARVLLSVMGDEERELLLLAKEHGAYILTLDGRIRQMARVLLGVEGLWPQVIVLKARETGLLSQREGSAFAIGQFLSNRTFVSLSAEDLLWMVEQGDPWMQTGISLFKRYLASTNTERDSAFNVALGFLQGVVHFHTQLGAFEELLSHLAEAMFRRPDCPNDLEILLAGFVKNLIINTSPKEHILPVLNNARKNVIMFRINLLWNCIKNALSRSKEPFTNRPLRIRILHCALKPYLIVDHGATSGASIEELGTEVSSAL